jgi:ribosomal protein L37AE/L43A
MAMGVWRCRECGVTVTAPSSRVLEKMGWTVFPIPVEERGKPSPVACPICKRESTTRPRRRVQVLERFRPPA